MNRVRKRRRKTNYQRRDERERDKEEFDIRRRFPGGERVTCDPSGCSFTASPSPSLLSSPAVLSDNPAPSQLIFIVNADLLTAREASVTGG